MELLQNATDAKNENDKISIKITINDDKLEFRHNGQYFDIKNCLD